jgi:hypothetical protein
VQNSKRLDETATSRSLINGIPSQSTATQLGLPVFSHSVVESIYTEEKRPIDLFLINYLI